MALEKFNLTCGSSSIDALFILEPVCNIVRKRIDAFRFWELECFKGDLANKKVYCKSFDGMNADRSVELSVDYDFFIVSVGFKPRSLNASVNCHFFMKEGEYARNIRKSDLKYFERVSLAAGEITAFNEMSVWSTGLGTGPNIMEFIKHIGQAAVGVHSDPCHVFKRAQLYEHQGLEVNLTKAQNSFSRRFSTIQNSDNGQKVNYNSDYIDDSCKLGPGDENLFIENLKIATADLNEKIDIGLLKKEFEIKFRPLIAAIFLMLPHQIDHDSFAFLHGPVHGLSKANPLYLSSLDIMIRMKGLLECQRKELIEYIISRRVLVADDWLNSYGNIEFLEYEFLPSDSSFVRAECDASFIEPLNQQSGKAKLAYLIWKERRLVSVEVLEEIPCSDNGIAEILAALSVLMKCNELKCSHVELWSDSKRVCRVLNGAETIQMNDANGDVCLLLRCMQAKFTKLIAVHKQRELMFMVDQLLRLDNCSSNMVFKSIKKLLPYLEGPLFRITLNKRTCGIINAVGKIQNRKTYSAEFNYFLKVEKEHKLDALFKLQAFLSPAIEVLLVSDFERKTPSLKKKLVDMFTDISVSGTITKFVNHNTRTASNQNQRTLVVVWDDTITRTDYYLPDSCIIILTEDEDMLIGKIKVHEINIEAYLYFNGAEFKEARKKGRNKGVKSLSLNLSGA